MSFAPTYSMYPLLASGTDTSYIAGTRAAIFTLSAESAAAQVREHKPNIVFLCSPNNPTGTALGLDVITEVYEALSEHDGVLIVDEAYAEFSLASTKSALTLLDGRQRLIVSRTMSKAFGLAGARVGYLAAAPEVTDAIRLVRLPYHLSAVTQATAIAALKNIELLLAQVEDIKSQRDRIVTRLKELGLKPSVSDSNFVFFGGVEESPCYLGRAVGSRHHHPRQWNPGNPARHCRTESETTAFLERLAELLGSQK